MGVRNYAGLVTLDVCLQIQLRWRLSCWNVILPITWFSIQFHEMVNTINFCLQHLYMGLAHDKFSSLHAYICAFCLHTVM